MGRKIRKLKYAVWCNKGSIQDLDCLNTSFTLARFSLLSFSEKFVKKLTLSVCI